MYILVIVGYWRNVIAPAMKNVAEWKLLNMLIIVLNLLKYEVKIIMKFMLLKLIKHNNERLAYCLINKQVCFARGLF